MQAIRTRFVGPTNVRGSRIIASCEAKSLQMPYRHELDAFDNHRTAAALLLKKLGWDTPKHLKYAGGCFGNDYYWCPVILGDPDCETLAKDCTAKEVA